MRKWKLLPILMLIILINVGIIFACKQRYDINENVIIIDIIPPDGLGARCNITTYNESIGLINSSIMGMNGLAYSKNLTILQRGTYSSSIICNVSGTTFEGECKFKVGDEVRMWDIAAIIGMLGIISLFAFLTSHFHRKATTKETEGELSGSKDLIKDANWFKMMELFCILLILFLMVLLNNTARLIASDSGASSNVLNMFNTLHIALIATTILFLAFFMMRFFVLLVENFKREKIIKEMGGNEK